MKRLILYLGLILVSSLAYAQEETSDFACEPQEPPSYAKTNFDFFFIAKACIDWRVNYVLDNEKELIYFEDESENLRVRYYLAQLMKLYPLLKEQCQTTPSESDCIKMEIAVDERIQLAYFHILMLLRDTTILESWSQIFPAPNVNVIAYPHMVWAPKHRYSLAEVAAGHPQTSTEVLEWMISKNLIHDSHESYPLQSAIINNQTERFELLLQTDLTLNTRDYKNLDAYLPKKFQGNWDPDETGHTPLSRSIFYRRGKIFQALLAEQRTDINLATTLRDESPLMYAAFNVIQERSSTKNSYFAALISDPRIDVNQKTRIDQTYLNFTLSYINDYGITERQLYIISDVVNHPKFDLRKHCTEKNACLAPAIRSFSKTIMELFEPVARDIDFKMKNYNIVTYSLVGKRYKKNIKKVNIIQYAEHVANTQNEYGLRLKARSIVNLLKSWKKKSSKS